MLKVTTIEGKRTPCGKQGVEELTSLNDMKNIPQNQQQIQSNSALSRRNLLDQTRLSRFPVRDSFDFSQVPFPAKSAALECVGCGGRVDRDDTFQQSVRACRRCLGIYTKLDQAFLEKEKRERREKLQKFAEVAE